MISSKRVWVPIVILGVGFASTAGLWLTRKKVEPVAPVVPPPRVEVAIVDPEPVALDVRAQGTVVPRTEADLVSQVAGEVVWVSPSLVSGGFFEKDEPLVRIDRADYEADLESARAVLARAESEQRLAEKELARQRRLADRSVASQAKIDDAETRFRVTDAALREARASVGRAERNLDRTELRASWAGRVRSKQVDVGQFVTRGAMLARLYAVDYAEVRLPLPDRDLRYLDVDLRHDVVSADSDESEGEAGEEGAADPPVLGPAVVLRAEFGGLDREWKGHIVRTEGEIDASSRMVTLVARVEDPYGRLAGDEHVPLAVGLFVEATIEGRVVPDAVSLPRTAVQRDGHVWLVGENDRLEARSVDVLRSGNNRIIVTAGLAEGERVVVSRLPGAVPDMLVEVIALDEAPGLARAKGSTEEAVR